MQKETGVKIAKNESGLLFFKEVAKYFMDFLETDFHKQKWQLEMVAEVSFTGVLVSHIVEGREISHEPHNI